MKSIKVEKGKKQERKNTQKLKGHKEVQDLNSNNNPEGVNREEVKK